MYRLLVSAFAVFCVLVPTASADLVQPGERIVDPRVRFVGIDEHQDHVFYLRYQAYRGAPPSDIPYRMIEVKDVGAFNLNVRNHIGQMFLLAIKRSEFEKRVQDDPTLKWLTEKTDGVMHSGLSLPSTRGSIYEIQAPVSAYRVTLKNGTLTVDGPDVERFPQKSVWTNLLPIWIFGIIAAVSFTGLGIWFVRRRWLSAKTPPSPSVHSTS